MRRYARGRPGPTDLLSCRVETQATVTRITPDGQIYVRFAKGVLEPAFNDWTYVYVYPYPEPSPPIEVGKTVRAEVFDAYYVTTINGATTTDLDLLRQWKDWLLVPVVGAIPMAFLFLAFLVWQSKDDSWLWRLGRPDLKPPRPRPEPVSQIVTAKDLAALERPRMPWLVRMAHLHQRIWITYLG